MAKNSKGHWDIDPAAVDEWRTKRDADLKPDLDLQAERARLTHEQANKTELEVGELRKELLRVEDVKRAWSGHIVAARSRLLSLPSKLAQRVTALAGGDLVEIEELLVKGVHEALDELQELTASDYSGRSPGANREDVGKASKPNGKRVDGTKQSSRKRK
jgi:phage terminase Nu1 subunit (DNA packaging protein)